jgi:DNA-binding protein HU-beta
MTKIELIKRVASRTGMPERQVSQAVAAMLDHVRAALQSGEDVVFQDFGAFKVSKRKARGGRNPRTGEAIKIPASKGVKFVAGKGLKEVLNG